jgi:hypothetical protein
VSSGKDQARWLADINIAVWKGGDTVYQKPVGGR